MTNAYKPTETLTGTTPAKETVTPLHQMDDMPPESHDAPGNSVDVNLHYASGRTVLGYRCGLNGWMRWTAIGWWACEDDDVQPIGWSALDGQDDGGTK